MKIEIAKKLVIITEEVLQNKILQLATDLGASGYTVESIILGKGKRGVGGMGGTGIPRQVRIEIITSKEIAEKIGETMVEKFSGYFSCLIYMEDVELLPDKTV
jgi:hypothetical protein